MSSLETLEVRMAELDPRLRGRALDRPRAGDRTDGASLELMGWVLGQESRAVAIEVEHGERVVRRIPLDSRRPDVQTAFPDVADADQGGFRTTIDMLGIGQFDLLLRVVLADQQRVPFALLRVEHRWREDAYHAAAPLVSVVIPCYDQARYLSDAIESVLAQSYPHLELVVVDDGSPDNAAEVAARYPGVKVVRQENAGLSGARNTGVRRTNGAYLIFLDADDRLLPEAVADGLAAFATHPEAAFVAGRHWVLELTGKRLGPEVTFGDDPFAAMLRRNVVGMHATVMYQRIALQTVGAFDETLVACEDYDLMLRIVRRLPVAAHDAVVAEYRSHADAMSQDGLRMQRMALQVLERQEPHLGDDLARQAAYQEGQSFWSEYYRPKVEGTQPIDLAARPLTSANGNGHTRGAATPLRRPGASPAESPVAPVGLLYHRIADNAHDPWGLSVSPRHFEQQLDVLRQAWRPMGPDDYLHALSHGDRTSKPVLITFDDGYADNLHAALPLLEKFEVPAVLFAASGYLGEQRGFWWDELLTLIGKPDDLPDECHLVVRGRVFDHRIAHPAPALEASWRAWDDMPSGRAALYLGLWEWLRPFLHAERLEALDAIARWAGVERGAQQSDRPLDSKEMEALAAHPLMTIGGHTVTHPWFPSLTAAMQRLEIGAGRMALEAITGRQIDLFAYPFGGRGDLGPDSKELVAEAGFRGAFLSTGARATEHVDPLLIPRRQVPDIDGEAFIAWLESDAVVPA